jgi:hypothetical protein
MHPLLKGSAVALALLGCAPESPAPAAPTAAPRNAAGAAPEVALTVDGLELRASELEPLCDDILVLYPEYSRLHARRLALTNEFLPRLAIRARDPERWAEARQAATAADLQAAPARVEGTFHGLGLGLWSAVRHQAPGAWSEPLELVGRFVRARLDETRAAVDPREEVLVVSVLDFPFVPPADARAAIDGAIDGARLTILDPNFDEAVPEAWKHRMRGSKP